MRGENSGEAIDVEPLVKYSESGADSYGIRPIGVQPGCGATRCGQSAGSKRLVACTLPVHVNPESYKSTFKTLKVQASAKRPPLQPHQP